MINVFNDMYLMYAYMMEIRIYLTKNEYKFALAIFIATID